MNGVEENIAYIAIGAATSWSRIGSKWNRGHIEFIQECCEHAAMLEELYRRYEFEFTGVFAYDVAEPFGIEYGAALIRGETPSAKQLADRLVAKATNRTVAT